MALFIQKPILWNANNYLAPSGVIATSGYPRETSTDMRSGTTHLEWCSRVARSVFGCLTLKVSAPHRSMRMQ